MNRVYEKLTRFLDKRDLHDDRPVVCTVHRQQAPCQRHDNTCRYSDNPVTVADILGKEE